MCTCEYIQFLLGLLHVCTGSHQAECDSADL